MWPRNVWKPEGSRTSQKRTRNIALWLSCLSYASVWHTSLFAGQLPTLPTANTSYSTLGLFSYHRACSVLVPRRSGVLGNSYLFTSPRSPPQITDRCVGITIPTSSPWGQNDFEVCFVHWFPKVSGRIKLQEPTVVSWQCSYWPPCLLCLTHGHPEITSTWTTCTWVVSWSARTQKNRGYKVTLKKLKT